jgi:hypothetical protein
MEISEQAGLRLGITTDNHKNYLPVKTEERALMSLGRFMPVESLSLEDQCKMYRSDLVISRMMEMPKQKRGRMIRETLYKML